MNLIAAVSKNWGIGRENGLLFHLPQDMKFFRETTAGKVVVMGRKTLESFPNQKPLPNRTNIVLTKNPEYTKEGVILCHDIKELFETLAAYNPEDVFLCGGAAIYRLLLAYCKKAYITKVDAEAVADSFLPSLDTEPGWVLKKSSQPVDDHGHMIVFHTYENMNWKAY